MDTFLAVLPGPLNIVVFKVKSVSMFHVGMELQVSSIRHIVYVDRGGSSSILAGRSLRLTGFVQAIVVRRPEWVTRQFLRCAGSAVHLTVLQTMFVDCQKITGQMIVVCYTITVSDRSS